MSLIVICENPACHFVVEVSNQKRQATPRQSVLSACPECGGHLSSTCPFSGRVLAVQWIGGLPHCACCHRKLQATKANSETHDTPALASVPAPLANAARHH